MQSKEQKKQFWLNALIVILDIAAVNAAYYIALIARFYGFDPDDGGGGGIPTQIVHHELVGGEALQQRHLPPAGAHWL